jgi:hypothetical protein
MKTLIRLIGVVFLITGGYYAFYSGFHLVNYDITLGLEYGTFGYGRPYWQIIVEFFFWISILTGGLGLFVSNKSGIKIGLYSLFLPIFASTILLIDELSKKLKYSTKISSNTESREMTISEQWEFIYSEIIFLVFLTIALLADCKTTTN